MSGALVMARAQLAEWQRQADAGNGFFQEVASAARAQLAKKERAVEELQRQGGVSAILQKPGEDRWVMLLPEIDGDGKYRVQYFDPNGFSGHCVYADAEEAAMTAGSEGFTLGAPGKLSELAMTKEWAQGTALAGVLMQYSSGQISYEEYDQQVGDLKASWNDEQQTTTNFGV